MSRASPAKQTRGNSSRPKHKHSPSRETGGKRRSRGSPRKPAATNKPTKSTTCRETNKNIQKTRQAKQVGREKRARRAAARQKPHKPKRARARPPSHNLSADTSKTKNEPKTENAPEGQPRATSQTHPQTKSSINARKAMHNQWRQKHTKLKENAVEGFACSAFCWSIFLLGFCFPRVL